MNLSDHPALMVLSITVASSLLAEIRIGVRIPMVVWELVLGMVLGPNVLGLARDAHNQLWTWFSTAGLGALLFMAGLDIDFDRVRGRPVELALSGWCISLALGGACGLLLRALGVIQFPTIVALALATTALGTLIPTLKDSGRLNTAFGTHVLAAGSAGEFGPILAASLILTRKFDAWLQVIVLLAFAALAIGSALIALRVRPPSILKLLSRGMRSSSQLPVSASFLIVVAFCVLAEKIGFEAVVGAFSGGLVVGLATQGMGEDEDLFREKIEAICFAVFIPFFFVISGMNLDVRGLLGSTRSIILVPIFLLMFLIVRGVPVLLYRKDLARDEYMPFALYSATALPMVVAITAIGVRTQIMQEEVATALIGAGLLSVLLFPAIADAILARRGQTPCPAIRSNLQGPDAHLLE